MRALRNQSSFYAQINSIGTNMDILDRSLTGNPPITFDGEPGILNRMPPNVNWLYATSFQLQIKKLPDLVFTVQNFELPGMQMAAVEQGTRFNPAYHAGTRYNQDELMVGFIVDERLDNWLAIRDWMMELGDLQSFDNFKPNHFSDCSVDILSGNKNAIKRILFKNCFPIVLTSLPLDSTRTEAEPVISTMSLRYDYWEYEDVA